MQQVESIFHEPPEPKISVLCIPENLKRKSQSEQSYGRGHHVVPFVGRRKHFLFPSVYTNKLISPRSCGFLPLRCWAPFQSHPESLSQGGEGWNEGEANWALCEAPDSTNVGQPRNQTQDPSQPGGPSSYNKKKKKSRTQRGYATDCSQTNSG